MTLQNVVPSCINTADNPSLNILHNRAFWILYHCCDVTVHQTERPFLAASSSSSERHLTVPNDSSRCRSQRAASGSSGNKWNFWTITTFVQLCGREPAAAPPQEHRAHTLCVFCRAPTARAHTHTRKRRLLRNAHSRGRSDLHMSKQNYPFSG